MSDEPEVSAHRDGYRIDVCGGAHKAVVRPWTMKQRAELKPLLAKVVTRITDSGVNLASMSVATLMLEAEDELVVIARATVELPEGVEWDELLWEDLPSIIQGIWETSIVTIAGGGVAGKAIGLLATAMRTITIAARAREAAEKLAAPPDGLSSSSPETASQPN